MAEKSFPLLLKLMQDDITEILDSIRPKPASCATDEEFALEQWKKEIDTIQAFSLDRQLAVKVASVPRDEAALISAMLQEEERSQADRHMALRMSGSAAAPENRSSPTIYQQQMCQMVERTMAEDANLDLEASVAENSDEPKQDRFECVICREQFIFFKVIRAPCSDYYCQDCLFRLFGAALRDDSLFPPRCCGISIPLDYVRTLIGSDTSRRMEEKTLEINDASRTYCSKRTCSAYILPCQKQGSCGTCQVCQQKTCIRCKEEFHQGKCVQKWNPVIRMAQVNGWKRCTKCKNIVELTTGCNHITCRCRYEFCYVCGKEWRTCRCPLWDERRLLDRANRIVARDNFVPEAAVVNEVAEMLRQRQKCDHQGWVIVRGEFRCERCTDELPRFIYECAGCRLRICKRCKQNRL